LTNCFLERENKRNFCISVKDDSFVEYLSTSFVEIKAQCVYLAIIVKNLLTKLNKIVKIYEKLLGRYFWGTVVIKEIEENYF